jgi:RNA polymerase sigma factor (sigma-70 family)
MVEMENVPDARLLREFATRGNDAAFREIVSRHTDLIFSAALRQVNSPDSAADIAQKVFCDLAHKAGEVAEKFSADASLAGWLFRSTRFAALNHLRDESRRRAHERQAMEQLLTNSESAADWEQIRPLLDEAMDTLNDDDRDALLLRFFKNKNLREVGEQLKISDDAAQKRVSRAVEKLREFFTKRKITMGASGLTVLISANAVQSAPLGLAAKIFMFALAGKTISTSTVIAATKTIAMTTLQKTLVVAALTAAIGTGIYQAHQVSQLREQVQSLQQTQSPLNEQLAQLQRERDNATNQLAGLLAENAQLKSNSNEDELLKLRSEVTSLRTSENKPKPSNRNIYDTFPEGRIYFKTASMRTTGKEYAKLYKDLHFTSEQAAAFTELLVNKEMIGMSSKTDEQINAEKADNENQIKSFLGEENFAKYAEYNKTINDRWMIIGDDGYQSALSSDNQLTTDQTEQLINSVAEERQNFKFTINLFDGTKPINEMNPLYTQENINQNLQEWQHLYQSYLTRAQTTLTPTQLTVFQKYLSQQLQQQTDILQARSKLVHQ